MMSPVTAPLGTGTTMEVALQLVGVPFVPAKATVLVPLVAPKPEPLMVMEVPTGPEPGERLAIFGVTLNEAPLLATLLTVTTMVPDVPFVGTGTTIWVPVQLVGVPAVPLNLTVLLPCVEPNPLPLIVTDVPTRPDDGEMLLITGAANEIVAANMVLTSAMEKATLRRIHVLRDRLVTAIQFWFYRGPDCQQMLQNPRGRKES